MRFKGGAIRGEGELEIVVQPQARLPLSIAGMGVSLYHYLLIKTDWFPPPPWPCTFGAIVMMIIGSYAIKKIIDIKV